jgi:glutamate 5-kinase
MVTKRRAARIAGAAGIDMVIANGARPKLIYDILEGRPVGTRFLGRAD